MVLNPLSVTFELTELVCLREGADASSNNEPYLVTSFYTVDGARVGRATVDLA